MRGGWGTLVHARSEALHTAARHGACAGAEVPLLSLRAAEHAEMLARPSHAWRVRTLGGAVLLELVGSPGGEDSDAPVTIHIEDCTDA